MNLSSGFIKSIKIFSPLKTLVIYFPSGYARMTVPRKITIIPKISPAITIRIFQVLLKHKAGNKTLL
jgi:hypothetical protein